MYTFAPLMVLIFLFSASSADFSCFAVIRAPLPFTRMPHSPNASVVPLIEPPIGMGSTPLCRLMNLTDRGASWWRPRAKTGDGELRVDLSGDDQVEGRHAASSVRADGRENMESVAYVRRALCFRLVAGAYAAHLALLAVLIFLLTVSLLLVTMRYALPRTLAHAVNRRPTPQARSVVLSLIKEKQPLTVQELYNLVQEQQAHEAPSTAEADSSEPVIPSMRYARRETRDPRPALTLPPTVGISSGSYSPTSSSPAKSKRRTQNWS